MLDTPISTYFFFVFTELYLLQGLRQAPDEAPKLQ